jgi:hypothetical protein
MNTSTEMIRPSWWHSELAIGLIALGGAVVGAAIAAGAELHSANVDEGISHIEREYDLARFKSEIISAIGNYDRLRAEMLLNHTLKEIDPKRYEKFYTDYQDLLARLQAGEDLRAELLNGSPTAGGPRRAEGSNPSELVKQFSGSERKVASRQLREMYAERPDVVIDALIKSIVRDTDPAAYRMNLYVAYTLAKIEGGWKGSVDKLASLRQSRFYDDPTFKLRVTQALANHKGP